MPQTISKSARDIVKEATARVPAISAERALSLVGSAEPVFVDLRSANAK